MIWSSDSHEYSRFEIRFDSTFFRFLFDFNKDESNKTRIESASYSTIVELEIPMDRVGRILSLIHIRSEFFFGLRYWIRIQRNTYKSLKIQLNPWVEYWIQTCLTVTDRIHARSISDPCFGSGLGHGLADTGWNLYSMHCSTFFVIKNAPAD
jgi:hypothetical protein